MAKDSSYINKTAKYNVYLDGRRLIGLTDSIDLPELTVKTEDAEVAGGTISVPIIGQFEASELTLNFQQLYGEIFDFVAFGQSVSLTFRIANQTLSGDGNIEMAGTRVVIRGIPKSISPGSLKNGTSSNASVTLSLTYYYMEQNGEEKLSHDFLNGITRVNGKDQGAAIDALI